MKMKTFKKKKKSSWRNSFFKNATKNLGINENIYIVDNSNDITDAVNKATSKFKNHPSIF